MIRNLEIRIIIGPQRPQFFYGVLWRQRICASAPSPLLNDQQEYKNKR